MPYPRILALAALVSALAHAGPAAAQGNGIFPAIEPNRTGMLEVPGGHTLYWESSGNEAGIPLIALHGGPGGGSSPVIRRLFDPAVYHIVQFDQRGAKRSLPHAEWRANTTQDLVADIERLRAHLGIDEPAVLFGLSWGTTLGLSYAQKHPERVAGLVLLGVFTCTAEEIDHLYHGGVAPFYPDAWEMLRGSVPNPAAGAYPRQLFGVITGPDAARSDAAVRAFVTYEEWMSNVGRVRADGEEEAEDPASRSLAVLENHYMMNGCFLEEGELLRGASRLAGLPVFIANGRLDMLTPPRTAMRLAEALDGARVEIVPGAGHVDLPVALAGVRGAKWIAETLENR